MVCSATAKPEGGFRFISVVQLCAAWSAYHAKLIEPGDLQTWFAAQEMVARRCLALKNKQRVAYTSTELYELTKQGRGEGVTEAVGALWLVNLGSRGDHVSHRSCPRRTADTVAGHAKTRAQ